MTMEDLLARSRFMVAWGILVSMIIGCAPNSAQSVHNYSGLVSNHGATEPLPRPDHIFVHDFAISPGDVFPDNALVYTLHHNELKGPSQTEEQVHFGRAVAGILSEKLVNEIRSLGLPAKRAWNVQPLPTGSFSVEGQFVSIDDGNRRPRRITIGFGAGNTKVRTLVQGYFGAADGQHLVEEFETTSERSGKPGVSVTIGPTLAMVTDVAGRSSEFEKAADADARRTTIILAKQLMKFFAVQGWIVQDMAE
jgi:hypothetical protein